MRSNKFRVTWSHNVAIVGPKKRALEATLIGDIWWTIGDTGTNYNEFELFKVIAIIVNVVKFLKNYVL